MSDDIDKLMADNEFARNFRDEYLDEGGPTPKTLDEANRWVARAKELVSLAKLVLENAAAREALGHSTKEKTAEAESGYEKQMKRLGRAENFVVAFEMHGTFEVPPDERS